MTLRADETEIVGSWKMIDGRMVEDETSKRIRTLIKETLKPIATSSDGWERLYEDPQDHRFWELTYPSSEAQGGGPPTLRVVNDETVQRKYKLESR
jgi:Immunity protein 27